MKENDIGEGFWVFVSHSTKDFEKVRLVRNALEDSGFRPILFYLKCMENEDEINELLKREIDARHRFILCDSPNAKASKFVQSEVEYIQSKKRMYEIIDLSRIDIDSHDIEKNVISLIKPFRRRTKVFLSFYDDCWKLSSMVKHTLEEKGFTVKDSETVYYEAEDGMRGAEASAYYYQDLDRLVKIFVESYIKTILDDGYVVSLISRKSYRSEYQYFELEKANEINPSQILPILIDDIQAEQLPNCLQNKDVIDVSRILSEEDRAKAIVEALMAFDLKNQYTKSI